MGGLCHVFCIRPVHVDMLSCLWLSWLRLILGVPEVLGASKLREDSQEISILDPVERGFGGDWIRLIATLVDHIQEACFVRFYSRAKLVECSSLG